MSSFWEGKKVVVTGGAGFIGSNLVGKLLESGADVFIVDKVLLDYGSNNWTRKLSRLENICAHYGGEVNSLYTINIETEPEKFRHLLIDLNIDTVFHLSAVFGGREFVDTRQVDCSRMLAVDHNAIQAAHDAGVARFHYASSACVYPDFLQVKREVPYALKEDDILGLASKVRTIGELIFRNHKWWEMSDNLYGWAKLMGELQCKVFHEEKGMQTSICRYLTVYGPGEFDTSHAISALIERALDREDPFIVWGSGDQERGFTYVDDIISGSMLAVEKITDGTPINLGWDKRYSIRTVAYTILDATGHRPLSGGVQFDKIKPEGPFSRALDISRAKVLLGWTPKVDLPEGLKRTIEWHKELRKDVVKEGRF